MVSSRYILSVCGFCWFQCEKGLIEYPEGCSKDIIQNAVRLFVRWGVLVSTNSQTEQQRSEKLRTTRPSGHFYVGEQSNVESAESSSSSSSESLDNDLCIATKCLSASAGVDAYRFKVHSLFATSTTWTELIWRIRRSYFLCSVRESLNVLTKPKSSIIINNHYVLDVVQLSCRYRMNGLETWID